MILISPSRTPRTPRTPLPLVMLVTLVTLVTCVTLAGAGDAELTPDELQRTARTLGAETRLLFGFPTGSSLSLTTSVLTPIISEGPLTGVLNVTWVPVAVPLDRTSRQLEYIEGARSRSDDLLDVYTQLQDAVEGFGLPGRPCLLRTLCEAAGRRGDSPLMTRVLQLLIDGSEDGEDGSSGGREFGRQLAEAKKLGASDVAGCGTAYHLCPWSMFDVLDEANLL